jgi:hypothetical protein
LTEEHAVPCPNCGRPILTEKFCPGCGSANPINYIDESVKVSKTRIVHSRKRKQIPIRVIIVGLGVALVMFMSTYFANSYAMSNMQFKVVSVSLFDFTSLTSQVRLEACNPTAFPAGFDSFSAVVNYQGREFARIAVDGGTVMPYQASSFDGDLRLSAQSVHGLAIALADAIGGNDSPYDESEITLRMTMDSKVLGIIPYTQTKEFSFAEFQQFMSTQQADRYLCE